MSLFFVSTERPAITADACAEFQSISFLHISYSSRDQLDSATARRLHHQLTSLGFRAFLDRLRLNPFAPWRREVAGEILACTHFFVVLGERALTSPYVRAELRTAFQRLEQEAIPSIFVVSPRRTIEHAVQAFERDEPFNALNTFPRVGAEEVDDPRSVAEMMINMRVRGIASDIATAIWPRTTLTRHSGEPALADVLGFSVTGQLAWFTGCCAWLLLAFNLAYPSPNLVFYGFSPFWERTTSHVDLRTSRSEGPRGPETAVLIASESTPGHVTFRPWFGRPFLARFTHLYGRYRLEGGADAELALRVVNESGAARDSPAPLSAFRRPCPNPFEGWICAAVPVVGFLRRGDRLSSVELDLTPRGPPSTLRLAELRLIRDEDSEVVAAPTARTGAGSR